MMLPKNPIIIGHEFSGELVEIGDNWKHKFKAGQKILNPASYLLRRWSSRRTKRPWVFIQIYWWRCYLCDYSERCAGSGLSLGLRRTRFLSSFTGRAAFVCDWGLCMLITHTTPGSYIHSMEIVADGKMAVLAGVGPMGLAAINYVIHRSDRKPKLCVVTDIDQTRLDRAASIYTVAEAAKRGIELVYLNTSIANPVEELKRLSGGRWL